MASNRGDLTGKILGTCTLERLIGQGGMGAVYLARQTRPARRVAVKVLLPNTMMSTDVYEAFLARFRREADVVAKLEHVNIMPIYEYGEQDSLAYLVMPYLTGGSLSDILKNQGALSLEESAKYIDQAASALDYAHAQGVVHRDLKPANFLLAADGRLVLADFGIARIMEDTTGSAGLTSTGMIIGTPEYMAPEMVNGEQVDYRADIYELGVVLFQMLSGHVPFKGTTPLVVITKHMQELLPSLHQLNPSISVAIDAVIQKATAKRREDRYVSLSAMAQDFHNAIHQPQSNAPYVPFIVDMQNNPTVLSSSEPTITQGTQGQYNTPPLPNAAYYNQNNPNLQQTNAYGGYVPPPPPTPYSTYNTSQIADPYQTSKNNNYRPLLVILGIVVALLLIVGGISAGVLLNRNSQGNTTPTATPTTSTQPTTAATATKAPTPTATYTPTPTPSPTAQPTATATPKPTPTPTTQPATVPVGSLIYSTANPGAGSGCDSGGGKWENYNGVQITCQSGKTRISNTSQTPSINGTFLTSVPGQTFPSNYVVQVQLQQDSSSSADFGIYFRNQPGSQQGVYTFLVHPDGTWGAYVYNNTTGKATQIDKGQLGDSHALVTLAVVVSGSHFTFYANGNSLGSVDDTTYASGTAGIAVFQNATITASNFELYNTAS